MKDYLALCKPRITVMVLATAAFGYGMAGGRPGARLAWMLAGAGLASCAAGCLNQFMERRADALMSRTRGRPLPSGRVAPGRALAFGLRLAAAGLAASAEAGVLTAALTGLTLVLYLLFYTPLKKVTPHGTWFGSAAGAMPPLIGWAAARGGLGTAAWILFGIQFLWQIPHFLAMFWLHRGDYARAGFRVMPVVDPGGAATACQIATHSFGVLAVSLLPVLLGLAGWPYTVGALLLGTAYLGLGMRASWTLDAGDTRRLFLASLAYLPILFGMLAFGGV